MAIDPKKALEVIRTKKASDNIPEAKTVRPKVDWGGRLIALRKRRNPEEDPTEEKLSTNAEKDTKGETVPTVFQNKVAMTEGILALAKEGVCPKCASSEHGDTKLSETHITCGACGCKAKHSDWHFPLTEDKAAEAQPVKGTGRFIRSDELIAIAEGRLDPKTLGPLQVTDPDGTSVPLLDYVRQHTPEEIKAAALKPALRPMVSQKIVSSYDIDEGDDVAVDIPMILSATQKLLDVNRGVAEPDERDSLAFRKVWTPDKLLAERIFLDAGNSRRSAMRRLARMRNLKPLGTAPFDGYAQGLLVGNPLSSPLEEINPLHLVEQQRRISQLGPGGIDASQITESVQSLHPSVFGFLDSIAGPESERIGVDTRAAWGTKIGSDGRIYQRFKNRRTGKYEWLSPADLQNRVVGIPD